MPALPPAALRKELSKKQVAAAPHFFFRVVVHFSEPFWPKLVPDSFFTMVKFSKERLEGRALEHVLAGHKGLFIRMYD